MIRRLITFFDNRPMGVKLTIVFLSVILIPMSMLAYLSYRVIDARLLKEAKEQLNIGLKAAWTEYYVHGDQMRYGMLQAASMKEIKAAVASRDRRYLKEALLQWHQMRPYVDVWMFVDAKGAVISRLNTDHAGDAIGLNGMVSRALATGAPQISTEVLDRDALKFEGNELNERVSIYKAGADARLKAGEWPSVDVMGLMVVTPVLDERQQAIGAIITGDVYNNDDYVPRTVAYKLPGLYTTIVLNGAHIATNFNEGSGRRIEGTRLDAAIVKDMEAGNPTFREWSLQDTAFLSIFEPILDYKGKVIGGLGVGVSKERLWGIQKETQVVIVLITLLGLGVSLAAAMVSTYKITRPLKSLKEKLRAFAGGDLHASIGVDWDASTRDELKELAHTFNSMMDEVSKREEEKASYLNEIEVRNREFSELNEALKVKNEEIEVAYEETQSQTEELHSINEELRLLNEDLDRKNVELKRANVTITVEEEALKKTKDKLRLIYDSIQDYILLVDYDRRIVETNRHFMRKFRTNEAFVIGRDVYGFFGMDTPARACPVKKSIDSSMPVTQEVNTPDGRVLTWHSFPLMEEDAEPRMAVVYIQDITDQRLLSQRLVQSDKLSSLGELVSGVAHELNNPLTGIMCFSELLMEDGLGSDAVSKLKKINDASHRCKKIIDNLLTFARWKRPEKRFENINNIIIGSVDLRAYQLRVDNIELELDLDENIPGTMLDENQIHQVFLNLINNARDAIMEMGAAGRIKITSRRRGERIVIKFEDNGKGMSGEVVTRIFDPFFTTKAVGTGTGLGLSISYGIINEHGGVISVVSSPGAGATFIMELPIIESLDERPEAAQSPDESTARFAGMGKGLRALVLDDEPVVLDLLDATLGNCGFEVEKSSDGVDALEKFSTGSYDIIVSDIKMPGLDGKGFYREIKEANPEAAKRIIFITGDGMNKETQEFLRQTGNSFLKKPFTINQLNEAIARLISNQEGERERD
ncbi:MAG: response regulator [Deltaproteobacteria bacterium]|nr:response regulator [Deltaproteobacteria bacterium]